MVHSMNVLSVLIVQNQLHAQWVAFDQKRTFHGQNVFYGVQYLQIPRIAANDTPKMNSMQNLINFDQYFKRISSITGWLKYDIYRKKI